MKMKFLIAAALSAGAFGGAYAQQVTKFVTGVAPGASVDTVTRTIAESMARVMKRTIVVENRVGASGNIAAEYVARAPADGTTALVTYNIHPSVGSLFTNLRFDPVKDFRAVGVIATTPYALVANPKVPGATLKEVLALAMVQGRSLTFASTGLGSPQHLSMERLKEQTGVDIRMVHYKSAAPGQTDVIGGHVDIMLSTIGFCEPQVKAGKLKVLAVTSEKRLPQFPDAPTVAESGYKGLITDGWYALLLPAKTPAPVVKEFNDALNQALASPAVQEKFHSMVLTPKPGAPEVLDRWIREEAASSRKLITSLGIKAE
jgi:tripartite-type tricarboxylate transporter receptor subunit TctC